jgi:putative hydrolase of the HAD superfamily
VHIEAVIFDWGGTLTVDEAGFPECVDRWRPAARHLAPTRVDEGADELFTIERLWWDRGIASGRSFTLRDVVGEAAGAMGVVDEQVIASAEQAHLDAWAESVIHDPEAAGVLRELHRRGLRVGLLSNTHWPRHFHEQLLVRDELDALIHSRHYSSELENLKPHGGAFRAALAGVGVDDPTHAVFVGDRPIDDISGAKALGMRTVWRPNPNVPAEPGVDADATIWALPELLAVLDRWSRD